MRRKSSWLVRSDTARKAGPGGRLRGRKDVCRVRLDHPARLIVRRRVDELECKHLHDVRPRRLADGITLESRTD